MRQRRPGNSKIDSATGSIAERSERGKEIDVPLHRITISLTDQEAAVFEREAEAIGAPLHEALARAVAECAYQDETNPPQRMVYPYRMGDHAGHSKSYEFEMPGALWERVKAISTRLGVVLPAIWIENRLAAAAIRPGE